MNVIKLPGARELPRTAPRAVRSKMDTLAITREAIDRWKRPPFQREVRITPTVQGLIADLSKEAANDNGRACVLPGIITLGEMGGHTWLVDGQHRIEAFRQSTAETAYADVRICYFEDVGEMASEFMLLSSPLVRMKNDDIFRALESVNPHVAALRKRCPFIGYSNIRQGSHNAPLVSMANVVRIWFGSEGLTPTPGPSSKDAAGMLTTVEVNQLSDFLAACFEAWGRDPEHFRLWASLNLAILMWLWRRVVLKTGLPPYRGGVRIIELERPQWIRCLMALGASGRYSEWLSGRGLRERDRSPCYSRIREIFADRLHAEGMKTPRFPAGEWAANA